MKNGEPALKSRAQLIDRIKTLEDQLATLSKNAKPDSANWDPTNTETRLKESEQRYRHLFERMKSGVAVYRAIDGGRDFVFTDFNRAGAQMEQISAAAVLGRRITEVFPGVVEFGLLDVLSRVWTTGKAETYPIRLYRDQRISGWRDNFVYRLPNGEIVAIYDDVTKEKKAAEHLRYHAGLLDNISDAVVSTDTDFVVISWNKSAESIYGWSAEEAIGQRTEALVRPEYKTGERQLNLQQLQERGYWRGESIHHHKDGTPIDIMASVAIIRGDDGQMTGAVTVNRDVSEKKRIEAQLVQNGRLASVGLLAAGVAHEINNPLMYVLHNLEQLNKAMGKSTAQPPRRTGNAGGLAASESVSSSPPDPRRDLQLIDRIDQALDGANRVRRIVRDLNTFSRAEDTTLNTFYLCDVINVAINMAMNEIRFRAKMVREYADLPEIQSNDGKLAQVFLNLLINATHSIEEGDILNNQIHVRTFERDGHQVAEIRDTGRGIPPKHIEHIFDPFFTTKQNAQGTGLGLTICRTILTNLGGGITVSSPLKRGSCFTVWLPSYVPASSPRASLSRISTTPQINRHRILVVDDEPMVAEVIESILTPHHDISVVNSGNDAQAMLTKDGTFDAIICDLMMPGITGMDLYAWLKESNSSLANRTIFMSGGIFTQKAKQFVRSVPNHSIQKPFTQRELIQIVTEVLSPTAP